MICLPYIWEWELANSHLFQLTGNAPHHTKQSPTRRIWDHWRTTYWPTCIWWGFQSLLLQNLSLLFKGQMNVRPGSEILRSTVCECVCMCVDVSICEYMCMCVHTNAGGYVRMRAGGRVHRTTAGVLPQCCPCFQGQVSASTSPALELQAHTTTPGFFNVGLKIKLRVLPTKPPPQSWEYSFIFP